MRRVITTAIAAALVAVAAPVQAQAPAIDLVLNPRIGLYSPLSELGESRDAAVNELTGSLALGLGAELRLAALPFGIRANLDYATGSEISRDGVTEEGSETTVLAVVGDVVFRPLPKLVLVQPYLFAGGGLKQYDFEYRSFGDLPLDSFEDESDPTVHVGAGLDVGVGPLALNAEVSDYISWWDVALSDETETQHDLFLSVGFAIGLF